MSYSVEWIDPIYDRTYGDVLIASEYPENDNTKGCYNASDLNRIENNTKWVAEDMLARRIVRIPFSMSYKLNWNSTDIPTREDMTRIIQNISRLISSCNPVIQKDLHTIYNATQMTYALANDLEYNLEVLKNQPELPIQSFLLTIEHGSIDDYNNPDYIPENEIVTIRGVPYGESAQYMVFDHWSGSAEDLACLDNPDSQVTTIEMPYRDVELTAIFRVRFPRTLTLTHAVINDSIGGSTRTVFAGDEIPILADIAEYGKRMYCWTGTEDALELIHGGDEPSTSILTMPDMDVQLQPFYINAGQHSVIITDTDGITILSTEWYDYAEPVDISAPYKDSKHAFASWSGDTSYLNDITNNHNRFPMPDINIRFTPTYSYVYGYHYVLCADNCLANNEEQLDNYMETSQIQMSLQPSYENGLTTTEFDYYQLYEMTDIEVDEETGEITNFTATPTTRAYIEKNGRIAMPDYDLFIGAIDNIPSELTIVNRNNGGITETETKLGGRTIELTTSSIVGQYVFIGWYKNNIQLTNEIYYEYHVHYDLNETIEARYEYRPYHTITVHNRNNAGGTETIQVLDGFYCDISTTELVGNNIVDKWYFDNSIIGEKEGETSWREQIWEDIDIQITYRARETFTITIEDGTIQDYGNSYTGLEKSVITIIANAPANKKYFSHWSTIQGSVDKYTSSLNSTTSLTLGRSNATVKAIYGNLYNLQVNTNAGTVINGDYKNGTNITMPSSTMPNEDTEWDKWDIVSGAMSIVNLFLMRSDAYTGSQDTIVNATYKSIPYFTVEIENGHFEDNTTTKSIRRNSSPIIIMDPAPFGMKFLMWEVITGDDNDISAPLAETTSLSNITHNIKVKATYYVPNDDIQYNMSITNKNGIVSTTSHYVGNEIQIYADTPDQGYEFYRWTGDVSYLTDRYSATTVVRIPNKNISLGMLYRQEGATVLYHVSLGGGKMVIGEQAGEPVWDIDGEFAEGSIVRIKADDIPLGWEFYGWKNQDDGGLSMSTVTNLMSPDTTLTVEDFDITLDVDMIQQGTKKLTVVNGETSGSYLVGAPATVYFNKEDTNGIKYTFTHWSGDTNLSLVGGGSFDINDDGDFGENPQIISIPDRHVTITGEYTTSYKVQISQGTINGHAYAYLNEGDTATIQANIIQGKVFQKWEGDVEYVDAIYSSTTTVTVPDDSITIIAKYVDENDQNGIGYVLTDEYNNDIINIEEIIIVSGTIQQGFTFTDIKGHIYVITSISNDMASIIRITKKTGGTDNGQ